MFYWWTVSLCHIEANPVAAGLWVSLFSYQRQRFLVLFRLLSVGWFVLPTIYEEMWTEILTEIKNHYEKQLQTARLIIITVLFCSLHLYTYIRHCLICCLYQTSRSHWTWHWLRRHFSILAMCVYVCACEWEYLGYQVGAPLIGREYGYRLGIWFIHGCESCTCKVYILLFYSAK